MSYRYCWIVVIRDWIEIWEIFMNQGRIKIRLGRLMMGRLLRRRGGEKEVVDSLCSQEEGEEVEKSIFLLISRWLTVITKRNKFKR